MISNFSPAAPVQSATVTGMRFCRKSPALGSMERHWPEEVLMEADVNARVAVSSRGFASAAADGLRTPPARETGRGVVGLPASVAGTAVGAGDAEEEALATDVAVAAAAAEDSTEDATTEDAGTGAGAAASPVPPKVNV
jgi:hypothetical protein